MFSSRPEVRWAELFGRSAPVEIDVGCGKGAFLLESAATRPDHDFLGIEHQARWVRRIAERVARRGLANVRVLHADAALVLGAFVPPASVRRYHVYFPDPWWKRRHAKRRLLQGSFPAALYRTLEPGGEVYLATDVRTRYEAMVEELARLPFVVTPGALPDRPARTNFERKYTAAGRPIYAARFQKPRI